MAILAIDAGTKYCCLALQHEGDIKSVQTKSVNSHSEDILPLYKKLIAKYEKIKINEIRLGSGPGSFTGLRIAYSFAAGLATGHNVNIRTFSSFQAAACISKLDPVLLFSDARREEYFVAVYADCARKCIMPEQILGKVEFEELKTKYANSLDLDIYNSEINAAHGLLGLDSAHGKVYQLDELSQLSPNYLRLIAAKKISER